MSPSPDGGAAPVALDGTRASRSPEASAAPVGPDGGVPPEAGVPNGTSITWSSFDQEDLRTYDPVPDHEVTRSTWDDADQAPSEPLTHSSFDDQDGTNHHPTGP